jgi:hypothetical protein
MNDESMHDDLKGLKDDIAFIRSLTEESGHSLARAGAVLAAAGVIFGICALQYWLIFAGMLEVPSPWRAWLWVVEAVLFFAAVAAITRGTPASGQAARVAHAAGACVGIGAVASGIALALGSHRLAAPWLPAGVLPLILFTLYGSAWAVAFAILRKPAFAIVASACFLAAVLCGALLGSPAEWLVLSIGLFGLVALPGIMMWRQARRV